MKKSLFLIWALALMVMPVVVSGCSSSDDEPTITSTDGAGQFSLPARIDILAGGEYTFTVDKGDVPAATDYLMLEHGDGTKTLSSITSVTESTFTVRFNKGVTDGTYRAYLKHGDRNIPLGTITITIVEDLLEPADGASLYGMVLTTDGKGVKDVVVSDGVEVVTTDANGVYNINSRKDYGYVFISVPSGYEVETDGVLPRMYRITGADRETPERFDFKLTKLNGQDNYKVLFLGDMHLAARTNDANQWREFTADVRKYVAANAGSKIYAVTLGDMSWDLYWYDTKYNLSSYLKDANEQLTDLTIFHTMGNHDNDMNALGDFSAEDPYRKTIAPPYYSFNIGKVHYVVLDDINCSKYDANHSRNYFKDVTDNQLAWLAKDLNHVDLSTPLVITSHAPFFRPNGATAFRYDHSSTTGDRNDNTNRLLELTKGHKVHLVTGHTHMNYNVMPKDMPVQGYDVTEHNVAAVCASWWWSGYMTPGYHVACDGAPGGYAIWDIRGTDMQWIYKGTGKSENLQFRSYDLNKVAFTTADCPNLSGSAVAGYARYTAAYPQNSNNEVLINIWNWNSSWTLKVVTETGAELKPTAVTAYDPLHIATLTIPRFNKTATSVPNFVTENWTHFFKVKCPDANTDLTITVQDEFGHTWTEQMARPKAFDIAAYK